MGVSAVLRTPEVTVDPGREVRAQVVVRNTSAVVDQFVMTVKGVADWVTVRPDVVNLLPSEEVVVEMVFAPPRTHEVLAGDYGYALRILSREDEAGSAVHEGMVTVTGFTRLDAQVVPKSAAGRRSGVTTLAVDNFGNYRLAVSVLGYDQDDLVMFRFRPRLVQAEPGTATFMKVRIRPRKYFWRGPDRRIPYSLDVQPEFGDRVVLEAQFRQRPLLPRRTLMILPLLLAMLLMLAIVVATLRQQSPASMAGPAPVASALSTTATPTATSGTTVKGAASSAATGRAEPTTTGPRPGPTATPDGSAGFMIDATAYPGVSGTYQLFGYVVPEGTTVRVTGVRLRDPGHDEGTLQIRDGDQVELTQTLATASDVDHQFPAPLTLNGGAQMVLAVDCHNPASACTPSATFTTTTSE